MVTRCLLGIAFTPAWLRIAYAEVSRSLGPTVAAYGVPLPLGCINEDLGTVEDSVTLQQAMRSVPCINRRNFRKGGVFLVVPQLLCYRTAFIVAPERFSTSLGQVLDEHAENIPGDRSSLIIDAYAHDSRPGEPRDVMVLAARRVAIEAYARLFGEDMWCIGGITTGEVARFNRWNLQYAEVGSKVALVCGADPDSRELSVWNRGVLMASDTRYSGQRRRFVGDMREGRFEQRGEQTDTLARDIINIIERQRHSGRSVECICFGGTLRERNDLRDRVSAATGIACHRSTNKDLFRPVGMPGMAGDSDTGSGEAQDNGLFDDAIGAIVPMISSLRERWRRGADGPYRSYA